MEVSALIGRAGLPPLNMTSASYGDWVTAITDLGNGPVRVTSLVKLDRDRWLLPGARVTLDIEPKRIGKPKSFTIDWSSLPTIRDSVAANDPTLADPRAARIAAATAMAGAGLVVPMPAGHHYMPQSGQSMDTAWWTARCDDEIARTATAPAPPGMIRVVAIVSGMRLLYRDLGHDLAGRPRREERWRNEGAYRWAVTGNETVFALNVAGRAPWAVFVPHFNSPMSKKVTVAPVVYPWLPALTPADGSGPPHVLWDEVLDYPEQVRRNTEDQHRQQAAVARAEMERRQAAVPLAAGLPPEAFEEAAGFAKMFPTVPPHRQQAGLAQLRANLDAASPQAREAYLALWRSYGIPI